MEKCYFSAINVRASQIIGNIAQLVESRCAYVMIHVCSFFVTSSILVAAAMVFEGVNSSSDEYSKTGRNPTNNPTHDLLLIVILADTENKKSSEILEFQSFALICYLLSRCVRDSNP